MRSDDGELVALVQAIDEAIGCPTTAQRQFLDRLKRLTTRLQDNAYQLTVLGQFKRGIGTFLNAFPGSPLLGSGILPLAAVPTFLNCAPTLRLMLSYPFRDSEERVAVDLASPSREIAAFTTDEQNPRNEKGVLRVDVGLPGNAWLTDVVLVDTPGIGSN